MRCIWLILLFSCFGLKAQLAPAELRCLAVLPNGDVKLTFTTPPDPGNTFFSGVVYGSSLASGPYTAISSTLSSLSTKTLVDVGAGANSSSRYYYMVLYSGPTGALASEHSDTLRTIFLNVFNNLTASAKELKFNAIHDPKLGSSAGTYTIEKEYPIGTWKDLVIQSGINYYDTLSVCGDSLNYRVILHDNGNCTSISNVQGGFYLDTKFPDKPVVDSISVLPDGNTVLAWKVPLLDKDVVRYQIQYKNTATTYTPVATVNGRNNTTYTYNAVSAYNGSVSISVAAIDSCDKSSVVNYDLSTMFLTNQYDSCAHTTQLSWNEYQSMPKGVLEYRIYYSTDSVHFKLAGNSSSNSFIHREVDGGKKVIYFVRVVNKDQSITASSNRISFFTAQAPVPDYLYIKNVTVIDKKTNQVNILIDTSKESKGIDILRSEDSTNFEMLGFVPYVGSPNLVFNDETAEPLKKSYYYKVSIRDGCGNLRSTSSVAKTMLLKVKADEDNLFLQHLSWSGYSGFAAGVKGYRIYRVINDIKEQTAIGSTKPDNTSYSDNLEDLAPMGTKIEYCIEAYEDSGNPYGLAEKSNSNIADVYIEGRLFVPNAFVPGGVNNKWRPVTHFIDSDEYRVKVFNRWGNVVFETTSHNEAWDGANCPPDIYVYVINYKNARGEYREQSGTVSVLR